MKPGFNVIDLSHKAVNPRGIGLEPNGRYQWAINLRDGKNISPVYCQLRFQPNESIAKGLEQATANPDSLPDAATIDALSESGNWHEILDLAATLAARHPEDTAFAQARTKLLQQAKLSSRIKQ